MAVATVKGPTRSQELAYNNLPFFAPEFYGFMGCKPPDPESPCLELSLFPHNSRTRLGAVDIDDDEKKYHNGILKACGIPDNEVVAKMEGLIISGSLAGPVLDNSMKVGVSEKNIIEGPNSLFDDDFLTNSKIPPGTANVKMWINGYPCAILNMIICHSLVNSDSDVVATGYNYFFDVTHQSIMAIRFKLKTLMEAYSVSLIFVRVGEGDLANKISQVRSVIIEILIAKFTQLAKDMDTPYEEFDILYIDFYKIAIYTIVSYLNEANIKLTGFNKDTLLTSQQFMENNTKKSCHIRIYSYKRMGRFFYTDNKEDKSNKSKICWLGIGQYLRYLSWVQDKFVLNGETYFPCKDLLFRDGHSTCPSILSSKIDRAVYNTTYNEQNILLAARAINYRQVQHIVLSESTLAMSTIEDKQKPDRHKKLGTWAGLYNSKNINAENRDGSCIFIPDDWLRQPFIDELDKNFPITIPVNSHTHKDAFLPQDPNNSYWGYGLDEHVLGYMFREAFDKKTPKNPIRILFYNVVYGQDYFSGKGSSNLDNRTDLNEYWKPMYGYMFNEINSYLRQKKPDIFEGKVITKETLWNFFKEYVDDKENEENIFKNFFKNIVSKLEENGLFGPQLTLFTLFGGSPNKDYEANICLFKLMGGIKPTDKTATTATVNFNDTMTILLGKTTEEIRAMDVYGVFLRNPDRFKAAVSNVHRYDRYDYYNVPGPLKDNGKDLMLTNATPSFLDDLNKALTLDNTQLLPLIEQVTPLGNEPKPSTYIYPTNKTRYAIRSVNKNVNVKEPWRRGGKRTTKKRRI